MPWLLLLALSCARPVVAEEPPADAERRARIDEAKRKEAADRKAFEERVNEAIDRGAAWLQTKQRSTGGFPAFGDHLPANTYQPMDLGVNALVWLTLAKSGVAAESKTIDRLKGFCLADYAKMKGLKKVMTYTSATLLMALDATYAPAAKEEEKVVRDRYGTSVSKKKTPCKYPTGVQGLVEELVKFLKESQVKAVGGWRYPGNTMGAPEGVVDLSNTQYALLGLQAAARCGYEVPPEVWIRAAEYVLKEQEKDGLPSELFLENPAYEPGQTEVPRFQSAGKRKARGWTYLPGLKEASSGAMTTAGIACLGMAKDRLGSMGKLTPELGHRIDAALLDGLGWLGNAFTVTDNPVMPSGGAMWHYYYLYGVERVGSLTGVRFMAQHDWYREGAEHLLGAQEKDGGWKEAAASGKPADSTESAITQTCFALLFLKRATSPPPVPITPRELTGSPDAPPTDGRGPAGR